MEKADALSLPHKVREVDLMKVRKDVPHRIAALLRQAAR